jgi:hypothetical protein
MKQFMYDCIDLIFTDQLPAVCVGTVFIVHMEPHFWNDE